MIKDMRELVESFGGRKAVSEHLGLTPEAVSNAIRRGAIPTTWHFRVVTEAQRRKIEIAPELFQPSKGAA